MKSIYLVWAALVVGIFNMAVGAKAADDSDDHKNKIEDVLIETWAFFKNGDRNQSGFLEKDEFYTHPFYTSARWKEQSMTFVFWMVDDDKDGIISLQEWVNNELGQFQLADKNHDGVLDEPEIAFLEATERDLFRALKIAQ